MVRFDQKTDGHANALSEQGNTFPYVDPYQLYNASKDIFEIIDNSSSGVLHPDTSEEVGGLPALKYGLYHFTYSILLFSDKTSSFPFDIKLKLFKRSPSVDLGNGVGNAVEVASDIIIFSQTDYKRSVLIGHIQIVNDDTQVFLTAETSLGSGGIQILGDKYSSVSIVKVSDNPK